MRLIQRTLYDLLRYMNNRTPAPSALVVDSSSVKTAKAGGPRGYDGGKRVKGRKRHIVVDTQGLMVDVAVTPANVHDKVGAKKAITKALGWLRTKPKVMFADGGYSGKPFAEWVKTNLRAKIEVSGSLAKVAKRFVPVPKRWVVERTFAWLSDYRRLDRDHERHMSHSCAMIRWAMIKIMMVRIG